MIKIELTQGKMALIDDDAFEKIIKHKWCYHNGYAVRTVYYKKKQTTLSMHQCIIGKPKKGLYTDHINRDKLDNRKCNLRVATKGQNAMNSKIRKDNTIGYKGLYWDDRRNKWIARIRINYKFLYLGGFNNKKDAARAYNDAAKLHHGKFANLNEIDA